MGLLLVRGARVDALSSGGSAALHNAAKWGHAPAVGALLAGGAAPGLRDRDGRTALDLAAAEVHAPAS